MLPSSPAVPLFSATAASSIELVTERLTPSGFFSRKSHPARAMATARTLIDAAGKSLISGLHQVNW